MNDDYDTPWKDALERYFPEFMSFYFPLAFNEIDWSVPCNFLDQELAQVARDADLGRRRVDKLIGVRRLDGVDEWVFVHVDVQSQFDLNFAERIFIYNYRIYDRYRRPVASLVVLGDGSQNWRPNHFRYSTFGCEMGIQFPVVKLNEFLPNQNRLMRNNNAFALVTAAHLLTQQTRNQPVKRYAAKWTLTRLLYARKWERQRIIDLFSVIDWMMAIPPPLQDALLDNIDELERRDAMPYMNPFEKRGLERGGRAAARTILTLQLERRFGHLSREAVDTLERAETEQLMRWSAAILDAPTIEEVFSTR